MNVQDITRFIFLFKAKLRQHFNFHSKRSSKKSSLASFVCYAKNDAQLIKFFQYQKSSHVIVYQRNRNIFVKFDEILLFFTNLMKSRFINARESSSSSLTSRFRQIWWIARNLMKCDYLSRFWIVLRWWIVFNLIKCDRLNRLIRSTYVVWQIENKYTSFVKSKLNNQNIDDEMIK